MAQAQALEADIRQVLVRWRDGSINKWFLPQSVAAVVAATLVARHRNITSITFNDG